jgi:hypothetical protein
VVTGGFRLGMMVALPKCLVLSEHNHTVSETFHRAPDVHDQKANTSNDDRSNLWGSTASMSASCSPETNRGCELTDRINEEEVDVQ